MPEKNKLKKQRTYLVRLTVGSAIIVIFALMATVGPFLYQFDPNMADVLARLKPPLSQMSDGSMQAAAIERL